MSTGPVRARCAIAALCVLCVGDARAQAAVSTFQWPEFVEPSGRVGKLLVLGEPQLRIGTPDGPDHSLFDGIAGMTRSATGRIALADAGNFRVLFFESSGQFGRTTGRPGGGPGEFRHIRWLGRCVDGTTAVHDGGQARLTFYSESGELLGEHRLPAGANFEQILWCSRGGRLFILLNRPGGAGRRGEYRSFPTYLIYASEHRVDTLAALVEKEYYIGRNVMANAAVPLGHMPLAGAGRARVFACDNHAGTCQVFDTSGANVGMFSVGIRRRQMKGTDWEAALRDHYAAEPARAIRRTGDRLLKEIRPRSELPLIDRLRVDHADNVWVRTLDNYGSEVATWVVISPTGTLLRAVAMWRRFELTEIGADYLLGSSRDDDGVEYVELYRYPSDGPDR